jgi:hypothetical protein
MSQLYSSRLLIHLEVEVSSSRTCSKRPQLFITTFAVFMTSEVGDFRHPQLQLMLSFLELIKSPPTNPIKNSQMPFIKTATREIMYSIRQARDCLLLSFYTSSGNDIQCQRVDLNFFSDASEELRRMSYSDCVFDKKHEESGHVKP